MIVFLLVFPPFFGGKPGSMEKGLLGIVIMILVMPLVLSLWQLQSWAGMSSCLMA